MNMKQKTLKTSALAAGLLISLCAHAETMTVEGFKFDTDRDLLFATPSSYTDAVTLVGYEGNGSSIDIPDSFTHNGMTYTVREIAPGAFKGLSFIKAVSIPDHVCYIGKEAFANTGIKEISIGRAVYEIGDHAFLNVPVETVKIYRTLPPANSYDCHNDMTNTSRMASISSIFKDYSDNAKIPVAPTPLPENPTKEEIEVYNEWLAKYEQECKEYEAYEARVKEAAITHATLQIPESAIDIYKNDPTVWGTFQGFAALQDAGTTTTDPEPLDFSYSSFRFSTDRKNFHYFSEEETDVVVLTECKSPRENVHIPNEVTYEGKTYRVVEIKDDAICTSKFMETLEIPDNIRYIGANAFKGQNIKSLTIGSYISNLERIGDHAFLDCPIEAVYIHRDTPPRTYGYAWSKFSESEAAWEIDNLFTSKKFQSDGKDLPTPDDYKEECMIHASLYVPGRAIEAYRDSLHESESSWGGVWGYFERIISIENSTPEITDFVTADGDAPGDVYDITGNLVLRHVSSDALSQLPAGIYIYKGHKIIR